MKKPDRNHKNKKLEPKIFQASVTFVQDSDSGDPGEFRSQELRIEIDDAGGGPYFVISTERWAFDRPDDIMQCLKVVSDLLTKSGR